MAFRYVKNVWSILRQVADKNVWNVADAGVPAAALGANMLGVGSTYVDTNTGLRYINTGTLASPSWTQMASGVVSATAGLGAIGNAKMTYDFAVNGGAVSTILPTNSPTIPIGAIILGGTIDITTTLTSGGAATIALETSAGMAAGGLKAATAVASWAAGQLALTPVFTAATYVKLTAAGRPQLTIATAALTAGRFDVNLVYVIGN